MSRPPKPRSPRHMTRDSEEQVAKRPKTGAAGPFVCTVCDKSYSRVENLTRHSNTHEDVARFQCVTCGKRFSRSDLLSRHTKIHGPSPQNRSPRVSTSRNKEAHPTQLPTQIQPGNLPSSRLVDNAELPQQSYVPVVDNPYHPSLVGERLAFSQPALAPWDGFMLYENPAVCTMGSYDADIAWTFDFAKMDMPTDFSDYSCLMTPSAGELSDSGYLPQNQYQPPLRRRDSVVETAAGEEEVPNDWPDNASRPTSPKPSRWRSRRLDGTVWHSVENEAHMATGRFAPFPYSYSGNIDYAIRGSQIIALGILPANQTTDVELSDAVYPMPNVLEYYLRLYFHHIHDRFPVLHLPTFEIHRAAPLLLCAMMLAGSSHAKADVSRFSSLFYTSIRTAVMRRIESDATYLRSVENMLTFLLLCMSGTWSGNKQAYEFAEGSRGILVTAARRCRLMDCRPSQIVPLLRHRPILEDAWLAWIESERKKRLGLAIYIYDCQYPSLFNNQPYISKAETTNCVFPCSSEYWEASNAESWKMLIGPAEIPPSTYYLHALNCCLLRRYVKPSPPIAKTDNFGKIVLIYALFTHIFEWRQAVAMLNPTGLLSAFGNSTHDIGDGLRSRRKWLLDSLDSFGECYGARDISVAASILHQLAYVCLNISFSDLHLAAGRLGGAEDGELAEYALKQWANSENVESTMQHVMKMLGIAHRAIEHQVVASASWEIAQGLFTGGLACWAYNKLKEGSTNSIYGDQVRLASQALRGMGCWRMCMMFGVILRGFESGNVH